MEAVPRLPMVSFELKSSPEATSFVNLKRVSNSSCTIKFVYKTMYLVVVGAV